MSCSGVWDADLGMVRLEVSRGPHIRSMGVSIQGRRYLYPEEAVFLLNRHALKLPEHLSFADWIDCLSTARSLTTPALAAYLYLRDRGFVVIRTRQYDRQLALNRHKQALAEHFQRVRDGIAGGADPPIAPDDLALTDATEPLRFCCWLPDQRERFKASSPDPPQFTIMAISSQDPVPGHIETRLDLMPLRMAVHDLNHVSFVEFKDGAVPTAL